MVDNDNYLFSIICMLISASILFSTEFKGIDNGNILVEIPDVGSIKGSLTYSSWTNQRILQFFGIPYAESPSGNLRFKAPVPRSKWNGNHDGTKLGKSCPSTNIWQQYSEEELKQDLEDCLNLYIYTKDLNLKQPVMVYIHGGGLSHGTANKFSPSNLLEKDIVLVAIQYRLGALGFLSTRTEEIPGNMGVLDSIMALEWINKNIKYFGGNPEEVTIFGESAGGSIATLLAVSPKVRTGLFHRVIAQSGTLLMSQINTKNPIDDASNICKELNCNSCDKIQGLNQCFQNATVFDLISSKAEMSIPFGFTTFDYEKVMPDEPHNVVEQSENHYPIMTGVNKHDGAFLFQPGEYDLQPQKYLDNLIKLMAEDNLSGTLGNLFGRLYFEPFELDQPKIVIEEMMPKFVDIVSTIVFKSPAQKFLELYTRKESNVDNYLYSFDYEGEYTYISKMDMLREEFPVHPFLAGVHHADDLLYLFSWNKTLNEKDIEMSKLMTDLWTSFAINGVPEAPNQIKIPKLENPNGPYFHITTKITKDEDFSQEFLIATTEQKLAKVKL